MWYDSVVNVSTLMRWLHDHEGYEAEDLLRVAEKPWHFNTEYERMQGSLQT